MRRECTLRNTRCHSMTNGSRHSHQPETVQRQIEVSYGSDWYAEHSNVMSTSSRTQCGGTCTTRCPHRGFVLSEMGEKTNKSDAL